MTKISFKGVSMSNMSIIVDMIAKSAINSNTGELKAIILVDNYILTNSLIIVNPP